MQLLSQNPAEISHLHKGDCGPRQASTTAGGVGSSEALSPHSPSGRERTPRSRPSLHVSSKQEGGLWRWTEVPAHFPLDLPPRKSPFEPALHMQNEQRLRAIMVFVLLLMARATLKFAREICGGDRCVAGLICRVPCFIAPKCHHQYFLSTSV